MNTPSPTELKHLKTIVSLPTAPFQEEAIQQHVEQWAARLALHCQRDPHGNLLLTYPGRGAQKGVPWVLQAHMDHPGFSYIKRRGHTAWAWFRGGVHPDYFKESSMVFYPPDGKPLKGWVEATQRNKATGALKCRIQCAEARTLPEGTLGMWDLKPWAKRGHKLSLRVVDDLCGVATILLTFERLILQKAKRKTMALLTRAEEVGFVGALAATKSSTIPTDWPVLGIEASKAQPFARIGHGAIIRLGDRASIFDHALSMQLRHAARSLHAKDETLNVTEALMPGGSCESTALALHGYRTCAVCLPLGNYHNMGRNKTIAPEQIDLRDVHSLLALLTHISQQDPAQDESRQALTDRLEQNYHKWTEQL